MQSNSLCCVDAVTGERHTMKGTTDAFYTFAPTQANESLPESSSQARHGVLAGLQKRTALLRYETALHDGLQPGVSDATRHPRV